LVRPPPTPSFLPSFHPSTDTVLTLRQAGVYHHRPPAPLLLHRHRRRPRVNHLLFDFITTSTTATETVIAHSSLSVSPPATSIHCLHHGPLTEYISTVCSNRTTKRKTNMLRVPQLSLMMELLLSIY
jgi:hypothetical protein